MKTFNRTDLEKFGQYCINQYKIFKNNDSDFASKLIDDFFKDENAENENSSPISYCIEEIAQSWWNNLSSLRKTQIFDTNLEILKSIRRYESASLKEITELWKEEMCKIYYGLSYKETKEEDFDFIVLKEIKQLKK